MVRLMTRSTSKRWWRSIAMPMVSRYEQHDQDTPRRCSRRGRRARNPGVLGSGEAPKGAQSQFVPEKSCERQRDPEQDPLDLLPLLGSPGDGSGRSGSRSTCPGPTPDGSTSRSSGPGFPQGQRTGLGRNSLGNCQAIHASATRRVHLGTNRPSGKMYRKRPKEIVPGPAGRQIRQPPDGGARRPARGHICQGKSPSRS